MNSNCTARREKLCYKNDCINEHAFPVDPALAMAYIVMQPSPYNVYSEDVALSQGTLFPDLNKPFLCYRGARS